MNCVTFETAKRLKEAGFPQTGHAWPQMYYWHRDFSDRINTVLSEAEADAIEGPHTIAYAPTATELLPDGWYLANDMGYFIAIQHPCDPSSNGFGNSNPAEAAAQAWLYVNSKQQP